jgi:hypothetical protein
MFVEDPGAANVVADLPEALRARGRTAALYAGGQALPYLKLRRVSVEEVHGETDADAVLAAVHPDVLVVGTAENPDTMGLQLLDAAKGRSMARVGVVDALANAEHRFRGRASDPLAHAPDWLVVPDGATRDAYKALHFPGERIAVCGHPHYDFVRAEARRLEREERRIWRARCFPQAPAGQPLLVFVAEVSDGLQPQQYRRSSDYTLAGRGDSDRRTDIVLQELLLAVSSLPVKPYMVLRLHPKNLPADFGDLAKAFDLIVAGGSPAELVYAADLVVGMTSMLVFEAALLGRPTLAVVPRTVELDWLPSIRMGLTEAVTRREDLAPALERALASPVAKPAPWDELCGAVDRTAGFIAGLLGREEK